MTKGLQRIGNTTKKIRYTDLVKTLNTREKDSREEQIRRMFLTLEAVMGRQHWWPADSAFEVVVGAYLTQNTAWNNVERAMANLRDAGVLSVDGIRQTAIDEFEQLVRPAGYFRQKAARLKLFVAHLDANHRGSLEAMFEVPAEQLREELLGLTGIGPETADSILLYAANREVFVVDTYTRRIFARHGLAKEDADYDEIRLAVQEALRKECAVPKAVENEIFLPEGFVIHEPSVASRMQRSELTRKYNEFHALLVQTAKHFCIKGTPRCEGCPLRAIPSEFCIICK